MPHLALPSLAGALSAHGVEVNQIDLNAVCFDSLLSSRNLRTVVRQAGKQKSRIAHQDLPPDVQQEKRQLYTWAEEQGPQIAAQIDRAKNIVRSKQFYDPAIGLDAFMQVTEGLRLASTLYYTSELQLLGYRSAYPIDASQAIRVAVRDRHTNLFRTLFQITVIPRIRRERPELVGISLTSADQVIAGFTLAALIKEAGLSTHVVLGGKMITCWRDQLAQAEALWELVDSAVVSDGENALLALVEALDRGKSLSSVPNLIYREGKKVHINEVSPPQPVDDLPIPSFDGLPLDTYLAPQRVLPVWAARGCYWGRCAFCNVGYGDSKHFREQCVDRVAEQMRVLADRYDTRHFFFADEALSPRMLKALSKRLIVLGADLNWTCCARFEPGLNCDILMLMRRAGCRMVLYGLESGSQAVLDGMHKGTKPETAARILRDGAAAGIWNHIFFFFGFPGETQANAQETIDFFWSNRQHVHSVCTGTFLLERDSLVAANPSEYGVTRLIPPGQHRDLAYYYDYETVSGIGARRASEIEEAFIASLPDKPAPHLYAHDIYRFLHASQFSATDTLPTMAD